MISRKTILHEGFAIQELNQKYKSLENSLTRYLSWSNEKWLKLASLIRSMEVNRELRSAVVNDIKGIEDLKCPSVVVSFIFYLKTVVENQQIQSGAKEAHSNLTRGLLY